jgi:acetoin utilization deacetylase AcuC-like enzyme
VRELRRRWRAARSRWRRQNVQVVFHPAYERGVRTVPLDHQRAERILSFLFEERLLAQDEVLVPRRPTVRALLRVHDPEYLESLQRRSVVERVFGTPVSDGDLENLVETQRMMVGGTVYASILAVDRGGIAVNLGGGLHHALRDAAMGFCLFNDIAVAIARLRYRGFSGPVLVVDLDMHDGNGTRAIFSRDPTVHTYSIHAEHWGEIDAEESTAIALGDEVEDELLLGTLLKTLPDVVEAVQPGLAVFLAGTDPAADDVLGTWNLTSGGMLSRDRFVMDLLRNRPRPIPVVVVLGGGYGDNSWKYTARFMSWLLSGRALEPPANEEQVLRRFRRIRETLDATDLTSEPDIYSWRLSDEDLVGIMPGAPRETRFLGYFSKHGVELLLERFGILDQLRVRGYKYPTVTLDPEHPLGQTVRILDDADRDQLLMELRVNRSQRVVPDNEVLVVEWLLLQNPRAQFGPYRRPLPGQSHPGLGLLKELFGWLVVVCEILELDGIYYSPSSYHVAAQSRQLVRFLLPQHEARYRALESALVGLDLAAASRAVSDGKVVDAVSGEQVSWEGYPMVLPVSDRLRDRVFGDEYEAGVAAELARLDLVLADTRPVP